MSAIFQKIHVRVRVRGFKNFHVRVRVRVRDLKNFHVRVRDFKISHVRVRDHDFLDVRVRVRVRGHGRTRLSADIGVRVHRSLTPVPISKLVLWKH